MKNKVVVINCSIPDSGDYDIMHDNALQNCLQPLWEWSNENSINVFFEKDYIDDPMVHSTSIRVVAVFESNTDMAMFKLSFSNFPLKKFHMGSDMIPTFV
jgi:hypothetical protein